MFQNLINIKKYYVILYVYFNEKICKYVCMLDGFNNFKRDVNVRGIILFYDYSNIYLDFFIYCYSCKFVSCFYKLFCQYVCMFI